MWIYAEQDPSDVESDRNRLRNTVEAVNCGIW